LTKLNGKNKTLIQKDKEHLFLFECCYTKQVEMSLEKQQDLNMSIL